MWGGEVEEMEERAKEGGDRCVNWVYVYVK